MSKIRKGDLVLTSEPFVSVVDPSASVIYCDYCLTKAKEGYACEVTCPHCRNTRYCNDECYKKAWKVHKYECEAVTRTGMPKPFSIMARLCANLIVKLYMGGAEEEEWLDLDNIRTYADLKSHEQEINKDARAQKEMNRIYEEIKEIFKDAPKIMPDPAKFLPIYGKVMVNSHVILDDWFNPIARGLYLAGSMIDHACRPNTFLSFRGPLLVMRSLVEAPDKQLNQVRVNYFRDSLNDMVERQELLRQGYFFSCHCHACSCPVISHISSAVKCQKPECQGPIFLDGYTNEGVSKSIETLTKISLKEMIEKVNSNFPYACCEFHKTDGNVPPIPPSAEMNGTASKDGKVGAEVVCSCCGHKNSTKELKEKLDKLINLTKTKVGVLQPVDLPSWEECSALVEQHGDILHPLNPWRALALDTALRSAFQHKKYDVFSTIAGSNLPAYRFHYGDNDPLFGIFLLKVGRAELANSKAGLAVKILDRCIPLLKTGLGASHPLITKEANELLEEGVKLAPRTQEISKEIDNLIFIASNM